MVKTVHIAGMIANFPLIETLVFFQFSRRQSISIWFLLGITLLIKGLALLYIVKPEQV